jgi:hypothetical protein
MASQSKAKMVGSPILQTGLCGLEYLGFGSGGKAVFTALGKNTHWQSVAVDGEGRILVAGRAETAMIPDSTAARSIAW